MTNLFTGLLTVSLMMTAATLAADEITPQGQVQEQVHSRYEAMLEEAERAREEAEAARHEARVAAKSAREMARELSRESARQGAEMAHEQAQLSRQEAEQLKQERAVQERGMARAREELSRAHRELREASREVARAHRDLSRTVEDIDIDVHVNVGDRAIIGVVLGRASEKGVEIIGVSPDGPAERAGLQQGDILTAIRGVQLGSTNEGRESVFQVMNDVADGEELAVAVDRGGAAMEFVVVAEHREPRSWQSIIRIPDVQVIADVAEPRHVIIERIEVPDIEHLEIEQFSEFGESAMAEANLWFGLPQAHGLQLASINEGLGSYFKTDRGVLVLSAREDNGYQLLSGDVILSIASQAVNSPADLMRALRDIEPGDEISIEIKRDRRDKTLVVVMPENRLGLR